MDYFEYRFPVQSEEKDLLLAFLVRLPFTMFEEEEGLVKAYLPTSTDSLVLEHQVKEVAQRFKVSYTRSRIPDQNWNAVWEANFKPIQVGDFCGVRADFHPPMTNVKYELLINPRMSFGTGHHATTYLMISMMRAERLRNAKVLDYGCGTGILGILAAKQGATMVDAVDIEKEAYENTIDNAQLNNAYHLQAYHGKLDVILDHSFDIILANINRNVILEALPALYNKLKIGGVLLVSGLLVSDRKQVEQVATELGFTVDDRMERAGWIALRFLR